jgi:hypothetical protein
MKMEMMNELIHRPDTSGNNIIYSGPLVTKHKYILIDHNFFITEMVDTRTNKVIQTFGGIDARIRILQYINACVDNNLLGRPHIINIVNDSVVSVPHILPAQNGHLSAPQTPLAPSYQFDIGVIFYDDMLDIAF